MRLAVLTFGVAIAALCGSAAAAVGRREGVGQDANL